MYVKFICTVAAWNPFTLNSIKTAIIILCLDQSGEAVTRLQPPPQDSQVYILIFSERILILKSTRLVEATEVNKSITAPAWERPLISPDHQSSRCLRIHGDAPVINQTV